MSDILNASAAILTIGLGAIGWLMPDYTMDKLATYRNTVDCWLANGNRMGPTVPNSDVTSTALPQCLFGMEVKKGTWLDLTKGRHVVELDTEFGNFPEGELEDWEEVPGGWYGPWDDPFDGMEIPDDERWQRWPWADGVGPRRV